MIKRIKEIIAKEIEVDVLKIKDDSDIVKEFDVDSLSLMNIAQEVEQEFNHVFDEKSILEIKTPQDIVNNIKKS